MKKDWTVETKEIELADKPIGKKSFSLINTYIYGISFCTYYVISVFLIIISVLLRLWWKWHIFLKAINGTNLWKMITNHKT